VIVNYHGGAEFSLYPLPWTRRLLKNICQLADVDLVIAHHSHTFQGYETCEGKMIWYSLGNFVFDISCLHHYRYIDEGVLLCLNVTKDKFEHKLVPVKMDFEQGKVDTAATLSAALHEHCGPDRFNTYWRSFIKDAYRTIYQPDYEKSVAKSYQSSYKNRNLISLFFRVDFYKRVAALFLDKNVRSLYLAAVAYRLYSRLRRK